MIAKIFIYLFIVVITLGINWKTSSPFTDQRNVTLLLGAGLLGSVLILDQSAKKIKYFKEALVMCAALIVLASASTLKSLDWKLALWGDEVRGQSLFAFFCGMLIILVFWIKWVELKSTFSDFIRMTSSSVLVISTLQFLDVIKPISNQRDFSMVFFTLGNPNFLSAFAASLFTFHLFESKRIGKSRFKTKFDLMLCLGLSIVQVWTESKQGILIQLVMLVMYLFLLLRRKTLLKRMFLMGAMIGTPFFIGGMFNYGPLNSFLYEFSFFLRMENWSTAWETFVNRPVLGIGAGSYIYYYPSQSQLYIYDAFNQRVVNDDPHNWILDYLLSWGVLVTIAVICTKVMFLVAIWRLRSREGFADQVYVPYFFAWVALELSFLISPFHLVLWVCACIFQGIILGNSFSSMGTPPRSRLSRKSLIRSGVHGLIATICVTFCFILASERYSEIRDFESWMKLEPGDHVKILENKQVVKSESYDSYRDQAYQLSVNSMFLAPRKRYQIVKKFEATGDLYSIIKMYEALVKKNSRDFLSIERLIVFYKLANQEEQSVLSKNSFKSIYPSE